MKPWRYGCEKYESDRPAYGVRARVDPLNPLPGPEAYQLFVSAQEMMALADMFRNEGPVSWNSDGEYFVTDAEKVGEGEERGLTALRPPPVATS